MGGKMNITTLKKTFVYDGLADTLKPFSGGLMIDSDYFQKNGS